MGDRNATAAVLTEIDSDLQRQCHLLEFELSAATIYFTDAPWPIDWSGNTYLAGGEFISFADVEETAELQVRTVSFSLSGVDQAMISTVLNQDYIGRTARLYRVWLDATNQLIADPVLLFVGTMDRPSVTDEPGAGKPGDSTVTIVASNHLYDWDRSRGRRTNHDIQQQYFPGDQGFAFVGQVNRQILWGRK